MHTISDTQQKRKSRSQRGADLVEAGTHSMSSAAREFGISRTTVMMVCHDRGICGLTKIGRRDVGRALNAPGVRAKRAASYKQRCEEKRRERGLPSDRELLRLARSASYGQLAARLRLTKGQVAGYIHRARKALEERS